MTSPPDPNRELIETMLDGLAQVMANETDSPQPMCTGWVLVVEWTDINGQPWLGRMWDEKIPAWRRDGMLQYALNHQHWAESDSPEDSV